MARERRVQRSHFGGVPGASGMWRPRGGAVVARLKYALRRVFAIAGRAFGEWLARCPRRLHVVGSRFRPAGGVGPRRARSRRTTPHCSDPTPGSAYGRQQGTRWIRVLFLPRARPRLQAVRACGSGGARGAVPGAALAGRRGAGREACLRAGDDFDARARGRFSAGCARDPGVRARGADGDRVRGPGALVLGCRLRQPARRHLHHPVARGVEVERRAPRLRYAAVRPGAPGLPHPLPGGGRHPAGAPGGEGRRGSRRWKARP